MTYKKKKKKKERKRKRRKAVPTKLVNDLISPASSHLSCRSATITSSSSSSQLHHPNRTSSRLCSHLRAAYFKSLFLSLISFLLLQFLFTFMHILHSLISSCLTQPKPQASVWKPALNKLNKQCFVACTCTFIHPSLPPRRDQPIS